MTHDVSLTVNGAARSGTVEPRLLLAQFLRENLKLTGTHIGCDTSQCGACTVLLDGDAVKSCTLFAVQADGCEVSTVEGLSDGVELNAVQQAFADNHGLQCGYCTPGFLMATTDLLRRIPDPSDEEIKDALDGNLCRCTGYVNIIKSVRAAATAMAAQPTGRTA
jgi:carbon-monoxide dehydrogenase small subunit